MRVNKLSGPQLCLVPWKIFDYSFNFHACDGSVEIISSWFSLGRLYFSKNLFISSKLSVLLPYSC